MRFAAARAVSLAAIALFPAPGSLFPQSKQPLTFERFIALKTVGDPRLSPDGSTVAFTVSEPSLEQNRNFSRIWLAPLAGGAARALTSGPGSDFAPRWAPDGRSLGFISTRAGGAQVWNIPLAGGDATQLSKLESGVNDFLWAPDGKALYVTSDLKWPATQEIDQRHGAYPTQAKLWSGLMYRFWDDWRAGTRSHLLRIALSDQSVTDLTPFDHDVPPLDLGGGGADLAVAPGGGELALVFNPDSGVAESTNNDVFTLRPDGSGLTPVTTRRGNDHSPAFSPDGRWLAYLSMETPGFEADRTQLMLYDRSSRQHRSLSGNWDASVLSYAWLPNSLGLVVEVEERGAHNLYQLPLSGKRAPVVQGGLNSAVRVTPRGDPLVFLRQSATQPPEVYTARLDGGGLRALSTVNAAALAGLDLAPLEGFGFVGALGDSVHGWLLKPPGFEPGRRYPLVYLIHGGPQGAWLDSWSARWNYHLFAARGYVVAAVNFHGSTGYGQAFTNSITKHWGDYPFEDLMQGLDQVAGLPYVDSTRMGAAGASYGGYMIFWTAGHTDRFKTLVAHDGVFNTTSMAGSTEELWFTNHEFGPGGMTDPETRKVLAAWSPANFTERWKTPMLIIHGQQDMRVDVSEGLQAFTALKQRGVAAKFLYFPDEGHWVLKARNRRLWWGTVLDWLDQYLKPGANNTP